jgi:hypothetical protein
MRLHASFLGRCEYSGSPMFSACKFLTPYIKIVAFWLMLLVLVLAAVIVVSSDDENPRDAFAGALIFFMVATVSYGYWTGFDWGRPLGRLDAENPGCDLGKRKKRLS